MKGTPKDAAQVTSSPERDDTKPPKTRFPLRHQYDEEWDARERAATNIKCEDPSLTQQHHTEDADINVIMQRFGVTDGSIVPQALDPSYFGDFTNAIDFRTQQDLIHNAKERFNMLPAKIRERFNHDPVKLWNFVNDPENDEESIRLGLLNRKTDPVPQPADAASAAKQG